MTLWRVYARNVNIIYKGSLCSKASCFVIVCALFTIAVPIVILFNSGDFWPRIDTRREQAEVYFKGQLIVILEGKSTTDPRVENREESILDEPVFVTWSSFPIYNHLTRDKIRNVLVKFVEEDANKDGKNDVSHIDVQIQLFNSEEIYSVKLLLFFDYRIKIVCKLRMETIAFVHYNSFMPGNNLYVVGDLSLVQNSPCRFGETRNKYNETIIPDRSINLEDYKMENIIKSHVRREIRTNFDHVYPVWSAGKSSTFTIKLDVVYPQEMILYIPNLSQKLKWAWIQYFSYVVVFYVVFNIIKSFAFQNQLFSVITEIPWKTRVF